MRHGKNRNCSLLYETQVCLVSTFDLGCIIFSKCTNCTKLFWKDGYFVPGVAISFHNNNLQLVEKFGAKVFDKTNSYATN